MRRLNLFALLILATQACGGSNDHEMEVVYDSCQPLTIVPAADTSNAERDSIAQAIAMWNGRANTQLTLAAEAATQSIPVRFEPAAFAFFGLYDDERGEVVINRKINNNHERAITIAHELGHAFGLWHLDARDSVMNTNNLVFEPNDYDATDVMALWGPCPAPPEDESAGVR